MRERGRLIKRERERERGGRVGERERQGEYENREGKEKSLKKKMCQNCMPAMNVNTLWIILCGTWNGKEPKVIIS